MTATNKEGKVVYEYNTNGTMKKATMPDGKSISYEYNDNKNVTQMTDYFGNKTAYAYIGDNYLESVTQDGKTTTYQYNNDGLPKAMVYPNGIKTTYAYDVLGNMTELSSSKESSQLSRYTAGYDKSGNRVWEDTYQNTLYTCGKEYAYDSAGRMKTERNYKDFNQNEYTVSHYSYDLNGNIAQKENKYKSMGGAAQTTSTVNYTYNAKNQLMRQAETMADGQQNVSDYTYDRNGNLLARLESRFSAQAGGEAGGHMGEMGRGEKKAETKTATYTYDPFNQLTQYRTMSGVNARYGYYAGGLRSNKTVNGVTTGYYYDGQNVVNEVTNGIVSTNLRGAGYISRKTGDNTPNYFLYNIHTDVTQLANENGTVVKNYDYDAWGTPTKDDGAQIDNPIRYAGEYFDDESGMIYLRARYYQPEVGRFISEDTHWNTNNMIFGDNYSVPNITTIMQSSNLYAYCVSNPIAYRDPSGHELPGDAEEFGVNSDTYKILVDLG